MRGSQMVPGVLCVYKNAVELLISIDDANINYMEVTWLNGDGRLVEETIFKGANILGLPTLVLFP